MAIRVRAHFSCRTERVAFVTGSREGGAQPLDTRHGMRVMGMEHGHEHGDERHEVTVHRVMRGRDGRSRGARAKPSNAWRARAPCERCGRGGCTWQVQHKRSIDGRSLTGLIHNSTTTQEGHRSCCGDALRGPRLKASCRVCVPAHANRSCRLVTESEQRYDTTLHGARALATAR